MKKILFGLLMLAAALQTYGQGIGTSKARQKLQLAEFAIANLYVDKVDENKLVEEAIIKMLAQLDPHSTYADPQEVKEMNEPLNGGFDGIGVQFQMIKDTLHVIQPVNGGPSEKAGILAGDRIIAVNDTAIAGVKMSTPDIMKRLRGKKGSIVKLTIDRKGFSEPLYFKVKRDKIPISSIDAVYMAAPGIGYVKISRFAAKTGEEFQKALRELKQKGMKDLVLDLQGNGGGYLKAAIDIANEFLNQGDTIVYTLGRAARSDCFKAAGNGKLKTGRLVVLIDEYSASASEIVTGAVQDWDRAVVVGRRSFGKGLVQRPLDLPDGSMIRLTVARYYTPAGRCIQKPYNKKEGADEMLKDYNEDILKRFKSGELVHADSIHFADSLKTKTKLLERTVYGGGGIMPDIFVPLDTTKISPYYRNLLAKGVLIQTTTPYIEKHRKELKNRYSSFEKFQKDFEVSEDILNTLIAKGKEDGIKFNEEEYQRDLPFIKTQIKALIARDLWDMSNYFQIINTENDSYQQALKVLQDGTYERILN